MRAIIYTYPPDYEMAVLAAKSLLSWGCQPVVVIPPGCPALFIDGAIVEVGIEDRRGNLNGKPFITAHLKRMARYADEEFILKVDSDVLVKRRPRVLKSGKSACGAFFSRMNGMQGCCYAVRAEDIPKMLERLELKSDAAFLMEDKTVGELAASVHGINAPVQHAEETGYHVWRPHCPAPPDADVVVFPYRDSAHVVAMQRKGFTDAIPASRLCIVTTRAESEVDPRQIEILRSLSETVIVTDPGGLHEGFHSLGFAGKTAALDKAFSMLDGTRDVWFIEDDVAFDSTSIEHVFNYGDSANVELAACEILPKDAAPMWALWPKTGEATRKSFNPICRLSASLIRKILVYRQKHGFFGHMEWLFPTLAESWTDLRHGCPDDFGRFWYRPLLQDHRESKIEHPVKRS